MRMRDTSEKSRHLKDTGTAVNIQAMVFGMGGDSATGVCFTRNPKTGETFRRMAPECTGADVVAGTHTPLPLNSHSTEDADANTLEKALPEVQHLELQSQLEKHYKDMQDIESLLNKANLSTTNAYW